MPERQLEHGAELQAGTIRHFLAAACFDASRRIQTMSCAGEPSSVTVYEAHGSAAGVNIGIGDRLEL